MENGSGCGSAASTVSREEVKLRSSNSGMSVSSGEVSSYPDDAELQLGLGLSRKHRGSRVLTDEDLPSTLKASPPSISSSSSSSSPLRGFCTESSPTGVSQAVGWPPIRAYRMNSLANRAKAIANEEVDSSIDEQKGLLRGSLFVKVNMDGIGIGRKLDINAHSTYESLALALEMMFDISIRNDTTIPKSSECHLMPKEKRSSRLLDGLSDFVLTYEDKDGDWMLVGDVPWGLFLSSVKRLRIMKASDANGLDLRIEERA